MATEPTADDLAKARQVWQDACLESPKPGGIKAIARALAAARTAPPGHIIDDQGVVRRVLGTLPVTADGCVIGGDAQLYWVNGAGYVHGCVVQDRVRTSNGFALIASDCYSTRAAAEAARKDTTT